MKSIGLIANRGTSSKFGFGVDAEELRRFFREYESCAGFKSTFPAMLAIVAGASNTRGAPATLDPLAERIDELRPLTRIYRTLRALTESGFRDDVVILARLHGHHHPSTQIAEFGDLSPIADITTAAIEARDELVAREGERRAEMAGRSVERHRPSGKGRLVEDFWREVTTSERLANAHNALVDRLDRLERKRRAGDVLSKRELDLLEDGDRRLAVLAAKVGASRELQGRILEAYRSNGRVVACIGAMMATDRAITVWDAIRTKLDRPKGLDGDALASWIGERDGFVSRVRSEAEQLRRRAHASYRSAKGRVST